VELFKGTNMTIKKLSYKEENQVTKRKNRRIKFFGFFLVLTFFDSTEPYLHFSGIDFYEWVSLFFITIGGVTLWNLYDEWSLSGVEEGDTLLPIPPFYDSLQFRSFFLPILLILLSSMYINSIKNLEEELRIRYEDGQRDCEEYNKNGKIGLGVR
jgi:hypothetical protein